jgi:tetratricopeptide (TPR) repeat protein
MTHGLLHRVLRWSATALLFTALSVVSSPAARSQENQQPAAKDAKELINAAYAKTKTAATVADFTEVIGLCEQARAADPSPTTADYTNRLQAWICNRRGEVYVEQAAALADNGEVEKADELDTLALADFETAVKLDPTHWKAVHNRGVSNAQLGEYDKAVRDFDRVIQLKPDYANAWFNRGEIRYEQGNLEQAVSDYNQVVRLSPADAGARTSRGHAYFQLRRFREALDDYNQAVTLDASNSDAYANRADAYQSLGQWEQAAADYRRAMELDAGSARAHQSAAWLMATCPDVRFRNAQSALQSAQKAVELLEEDDYQFLDTLAAAYASAGRFDDAKTTINNALKLAPESAAGPLRQRLTLYEQGQPFRQGAAAVNR